MLSYKILSSIYSNLFTFPHNWHFQAQLEIVILNKLLRDAHYCRNLGFTLLLNYKFSNPQNLSLNKKYHSNQNSQPYIAFHHRYLFLRCAHKLFLNHFDLEEKPNLFLLRYHLIIRHYQTSYQFNNILITIMISNLKVQFKLQLFTILLKDLITTFESI